MQNDLNLTPLFEPFRVGTLEFPNRLIMPAMQRELAPEGIPGPAMAEHYRRRIEGGIALIIGEGTAVNHPSATHYWKYALLSQAAIEGWKRVLDAVKGAGGRLFLQLWHEGAVRKEGEGPHPEAPTLSPSGLIRAGELAGRAMNSRELGM